MSTRVARDQLRSYVERIERLQEEKKAITDDINEVKAEAKANGYDLPALNAVIKLRKMESHERQEHLALVDLYSGALGMTPIEQHIEKTEKAEKSENNVVNMSDKRPQKRKKGQTIEDDIAAAHQLLSESAGKCSTSYVQRGLSIGYNRAAQIIEILEERKIVSPANHVGKRKLLVSLNKTDDQQKKPKPVKPYDHGFGIGEGV
jgi:uncharacterized protein (UPF0335 family)